MFVTEINLSVVVIQMSIYLTDTQTIRNLHLHLLLYKDRLIRIGLLKLKS